MSSFTREPNLDEAHGAKAPHFKSGRHIEVGFLTRNSCGMVCTIRQILPGRISMAGFQRFYHADL